MGLPVALQLPSSMSKPIFGGAVEWLPGAPLGNSGMSWSDVLLGDLPNVYVYAANNPSESIVAKRRGYGTIVSHNVPPYGRYGPGSRIRVAYLPVPAVTEYSLVLMHAQVAYMSWSPASGQLSDAIQLVQLPCGRAGLYKQLSELKSMLGEVRDDPAAAETLKEAIVKNLDASGKSAQRPQVAGGRACPSISRSTAAESRHETDVWCIAGLAKDCPFRMGQQGQEDQLLTVDSVADVSAEDFVEYASRLYAYLQVLQCKCHLQSCQQRSPAHLRDQSKQELQGTHQHLNQGTAEPCKDCSRSGRCDEAQPDAVPFGGV